MVVSTPVYDLLFPCLHNHHIVQRGATTSVDLHLSLLSYVLGRDVEVWEDMEDMNAFMFCLVFACALSSRFVMSLEILTLKMVDM